MVMDYLRKCYLGTIRVFIDGVPRYYNVRWYWAPKGAPMFPFAHCWGTHVYKSYLQWDEGGPIEIDRLSRGYDDNPGYLAQCFVGKKEWWQSGNIPGSALFNPPSLPDCCFKWRSNTINGKASIHLCNPSFVADYGWIRTHPAVALDAHGRLVQRQQLDGRAPVAVGSEAFVFHGGRIQGRAPIGFNAAAGLVYAPAIAGKAPLALTSPGHRLRMQQLAGQAELLLSAARTVVGPQTIRGLAGLQLAAAAEWVHRQDLDGQAAVELLSVGRLTEEPELDGLAGLRLAAAAELVYGPELDGLAGLRLAAAAELVQDEAIHGAAGLVVTSAGALVYAPSMRGKGTIVLTSNGHVFYGTVITGTTALLLASAAGLVYELSIDGDASMNLTAKVTLTQVLPVVPTNSCSTAPTMAADTKYNFSEPGGSQWFTKFPIVSGHTYYVKWWVNSGAGGAFANVNVWQDGCPVLPSPTLTYNATGVPYVHCATFGATVTDWCYVGVNPGFGTVGYSVQAGEGACPP